MRRAEGTPMLAASAAAVEAADRVLVAQLGARHHYAVPRILEQAGLLQRFFTDSYSGNKPVLRAAVASLNRLRRTDAAARWLARSGTGLPPGKVTSFELMGFAYVRARRRASDSSAMRAVFHHYNVAFNRAVLRHGLGDAAIVYGFNSASLELFTQAKKEGRRCILDQTVAPRPVLQRLLASAAGRWPGWDRQRSPEAAHERDEQREAAEWAAADVILCPSAFVRDAIAEVGGPVEKCRLVPYGTDSAQFPPRVARTPPHGRPLRVLFAGEVGLRKGVPDLLEALKQLTPRTVEGRFVGKVALDRDKLAAYGAVATFTGAVPRPLMPEHYAWADVFVFPSLCEGSAAVLSEALASGLPVICTPNSGPPPARGGLRITPAGDPQAIADAILAVRDDYAAALPPVDPDPPFAIAAYGRRLVAAVRDVCTAKPDTLRMQQSTSV